MTGTDPEPGGRPPHDRTFVYRPDGAPQPPPLPADAPKIPGITLNHEIARGGMGVVYAGRQDFLDRRVAVKLLSRDLAGEKFAQRFQREAKILAGIKHAHIVACHAAGTTEDGQSYLVMEFVDGPNLKAWIEDHGAVPCAAALRMTKALGQALSHAHQLDVIHRDVKPENILLEAVTSTAIDVSFPFTPKLVDLGLARMASETVGFGLTSPGAVMGTPTTMSPEQFDDPDSVDFRTDIYGLGCVLYEMLVGKAAYRGNKMTEIVLKKRQPIGPNPCDENPSVPASVGTLVCSMLAAEREDRPRSYKDLDEQIDQLLAALPAKARTAPPPAPTKPPPSKSPPKGPPPKGEPSGPGLLRTAELDFLQEGLGAQRRTAFQESPGSPTPPAAPSFAGTATVPLSAPPAEPSPVPKPRNRVALLGSAAVVLLAGVGVVWMTSRGSSSDPEKPPVSPPTTNRAPVVSIAGPEQASLMKVVALHAEASDPDGDALEYAWSAPNAPEVTFRSQDKNTVQAVVMDGLPGERFAVEVAVHDSKGTRTTATKLLELAGEQFPTRQLLRGCKDGDSRWVFEPAEAPPPAWTWRDDRPNGWLSCRTLGAVRTMTWPVPDEAFWRIEGRLGSRKDDADPRFAETIVRLEVGDDGWSLHCRREGDLGERWSIELCRSKRVTGAWSAEPMSPTRRKIDWVMADDADQEPHANLSITRRRETLVFRFGRFDEGKIGEYEIAVPESASLRLALAVEGGAGEFRGFTLW